MVSVFDSVMGFPTKQPRGLSRVRSRCYTHPFRLTAPVFKDRRGPELTVVNPGLIHSQQDCGLVPVLKPERPVKRGLRSGADNLIIQSYVPGPQRRVPFNGAGLAGLSMKVC